MKYLIGLVALVLAGCCRTTTQEAINIRAADGQHTQVALQCNNEVDCLKTSGDECPSGYDIVSTYPPIYARHWILIQCVGKSRKELEAEPKQKCIHGC